MNKYEEALSKLLGVDLAYYFANEEIQPLLQLVERATPMKPIMSGAYQGLTFDVCPICDKSLPHNSKFCSQCGQAIMRGDK